MVYVPGASCAVLRSTSSCCSNRSTLEQQMRLAVMSATVDTIVEQGTHK